MDNNKQRGTKLINNQLVLLGSVAEDKALCRKIKKSTSSFRLLKFIMLAALIGGSYVNPVLAEWQWTVGLENRYFWNEGKYPEQTDMQPSVFIQPEYQWRSEAGNRNFKFIGFYRHDFEDEQRSQGDVREALFSHWFDDYEYRIGVGKVYWGVTESLQLVDIINQTDSVDAIDGDSKLGQPMIHGLWYSNFGRWEGFILPGFREATFSGTKGRFRSRLAVDDRARYEDDDEDSHIDYALRWSHSFDVLEEALDVTANYFTGTSRDPIIEPQIAQVEGQNIVTGLQAYYPQIDQYSATAQYTWGNWLLKAEGLIRNYSDNELDNYRAAVSGFEYTLYAPFDLAADVGLLLEYQYDERGFTESANHKDIFIGSRIAFNDAASTELLFGLTQDLDRSQSQVFFAEASRRINNNMTIDLNLLMVGAADSQDPLFIASSDDTAEVAINIYF